MNNPHVELNAIAKIMSDKDPNLLVSIFPEHFANKDLANIYKIIRNAYVDTGNFIGFDVLIASVTDKCKSQDRAKFLADLLLQVKERDITGLTSESLLKELNDYHKFRLVLDQAKQLVESVEQKDIDATLGTIQSMHEKIFMQSAGSLEDADSVSLMGKKVKYSFRKCGIPELDERGPFIEGGLAILAGASGKGKSNMALQFDLYDYFNYPDSSNSYFSYELSKVEIYSRAISQIAEVDVGNIMSDILTEEERIKVRAAELIFHYDVTKENATDMAVSTIKDSTEEFNELAKNSLTRRPNRFYIFDETCGFDALLLKMKLLRDTKNVRRFTLDYLTLIGPSAKAKGEARWLQPVIHSEQLKMFAKEDGRKSWICTPVQFNEKDSEIKFSKNIENAVDLYLKFTQDEDDKALNTVSVEYGKFRTYLTVPNKPLKGFKLIRQFEFAKFQPFNF